MSDSFWVYILIPVISAVVGYGTNVLAIIMTFQPLEFWPLKVWQIEGEPWGLFGWQGIIPAKAVEMTETLCTVFLERVVDVDEIFSRLDPNQIAELATSSGKMKEMTRSLVEKVAEVQLPAVWKALSPKVKEELLGGLLEGSGRFITLLMAELQAGILHVLDLCGLMKRIVASDKQILCDMFLQTGGREFTFIRRSGFYFGFLFGLLQAVVYIFYKGAWVLPVAGFLVGYLTNWLALKLIFEPAQPIVLGGMRIQGLFLKRQKEAASTIAAASMHYFLSQEQLWSEIFYGERRDRWQELLERVTEQYVHESMAASSARRIAAVLLVGDAGTQALVELTAKHIGQSLPHMLPMTFEYMDSAMNVESTMRSSLELMPPDEFINILRPAFQADEWKLILVGGILGAAAGAIQQFAVFSNL